MLLSAKNSAFSSSAYVELLGHLEVREDRVDRARLDAGVAVDAQLRVDVELLRGLEVGRPGLRMDAVDGTDLDARVVLDAASGNHVGHVLIQARYSFEMPQQPARMTSPSGRLEVTFVPGAGMVGWSLRHDGDELLGHRASLSEYIDRGKATGIPLLRDPGGGVSTRRAPVVTVCLACARDYSCRYSMRWPIRP